MKVCYTCKKALAEEEFNKNILKKDGLEYQCRESQKKRTKIEYWKHRERRLRRNKIAYWKDPEKKLKQNRYWYANNKEKHKALRTRWYQQNKEKAYARWQTRKERQHQAGGMLTKKEKTELFNKYENKCLCCGAKEKLVADHVIPVSLGGSNNSENRQPLCFSCNAKKALKVIDYRYGFKQKAKI